MAVKVDANPTMASRIGSMDLKDVFEVALGKVISQEVSRRTPIGDANFKSAIAKGIVAYLGNRYVSQRDVKMLLLGVGVDGLEDVLYAFLRGSAFAIRNPFANAQQVEEW